MIARMLKAKHVVSGDHVLAASTLDKVPVMRQVGSVLFGDMYAGNGFWWKEQTEGTYAWPAPDVYVEPDERVLVFR